MAELNIFVWANGLLCCGCHLQFYDIHETSPCVAMGRKRKAGGKPFGQSSDDVPQVKTKFAADETFNDSEDEFFAGRDKILLEERPEVKRRRQIEGESTLSLNRSEVRGG